MTNGAVFACAAALLALGSLAACAKKAELLPPPIPAAERKARIEVAPLPAHLQPAALIRATVTITNGGRSPFPAEGAGNLGNRVNLSYHWLDAQGRMLEYDGVRTVLPRPLAPGEKVTVTARVLVPARPGAYKLQFDLVQEWVAWFDLKDAVISVTVEEPPRSGS